MLVVAVLTIRDGAIEEFRRYERLAAEIMARYSGKIAHAFHLAGSPLREVHVVRFPDDDAFAAYLADPDQIRHREFRDTVIITTEVWVERDVSEVEL